MHYHVHTNQSGTCPFPEPNQLNLHPSTDFWKIHFNVTLPSRRRFSKWPLSLRIPYDTLYAHLHSSIRATFHAHIILLVLITVIIFVEQYKSWSYPLRSFFHFSGKTAQCCMSISFLYMFRTTMCMPDTHPHKITSTKCRINTVVSPDDRHIVARNM